MSPSKARNRKGRPSTAQRRKYRLCIAGRDGYACLYCRAPFAADLSDATLDHFIPRALWPANHLTNLVLACERCNTVKGDVLPWPLVWLLLAVFRQSEWEVAA
ncbi:HNH endonuclease [Streptomyces sp. KN37]|uniref:HNH endonuclease n=1 Tax=Streptomyces sp. KN37 TaxID=3090667 RepID=UPI002A75E5DE|nr:HNH endonuclease [Streptomyces sp. KN37]WPO69941.1 HNH endonuclease domain-containing protein [Streptomyces sp. KN37]